MRRTITGLAIAACLGAITDDAQARDEVIAVVLGETFMEKDFLYKGANRKHRMQIAVNKFRMTAARKLVRHRMPGCPVEPTSEQVSQYVTWWHDNWAKMRAAGLAQVSQSDSPGQEAIRNSMERLPSADVISSGNPIVTKKAREEVEAWLVWSCVQEALQGQTFFAPRPLTRLAAGDKALLRFKSIGGIPHPTVPATPEPVASLGNFFRQAEKDGQLVFRDQKRRDYFFERYTSDKFANVPPDEALERLNNPYWQQVDKAGN